MVDNSQKPKVGILMGSDSDLDIMAEAEKRLDAFGIRYETRILSAHRTPHETQKYAESASEFVSYGYDSRALYGFAYRKLKRRMQVLGLECPPAEELMPGPIATPEEARAAGAPV